MKLKQLYIYIQSLLESTHNKLQDYLEIFLFFYYRFIIY